MLDFKPGRKDPVFGQDGCVPPDIEPDPVAFPNTFTETSSLPEPVLSNANNLCGRFVLSFDGDSDWSVLNFLTGGLRSNYRDEPAEQKPDQTGLAVEIGNTVLTDGKKCFEFAEQ